MSTVYLSLGYTYNFTVDLSKDADELRAILEKYTDQIEEKIEYIDMQGWCEATDTDPVTALLDGLYAHAREEFDFDDYLVPTPDSELFFRVSGGESYGGESLFDSFDQLCLLTNACEAIPDLGREVGILGGGIRLGY